MPPVRITLLVSVFVQILVAGSVAAQSSAAKPAPARADGLISVDFNRAPLTLESYVNAVKEAMRAQGKRANVVIDANLQGMILPPAQLSGVTLSQALQWIANTALAKKYGLVLQTSRAGCAEPDCGVFVFTAAQPPAAPPQVPVPPALEQQQVRTYDLKAPSYVVTTRTPEQIKQAVEDAFTMQNPAAKDQLKFNPQTGLLHVRGSAQDISVANQVIDEMRQNQRQATLAQMQAEIERLRAELGTLTKTASKPVK